MKLLRTANAGVLLELDDVEILLDGVCREVGCYPATPPEIRRALAAKPPRAVLFTHTHPDHFDEEFAGGAVLPNGGQHTRSVGAVRITALPTRHMGKAEGLHQSFAVQGSRCLWFLGDAAPTELKKFAGFPRPDVLLVPYPYVSTPPALRLVEALLPCQIVLLHLPPRETDPQGLWQIAQAGMELLRQWLIVPQLGQTMEL